MQSVMTQFLTQVDEIKKSYAIGLAGVSNNLEEAYRMNNGSVVSSASADLNVDTIYSGEENYGQFLDLHVFHDAFNNLKCIPTTTSYIQYLDVYCKFSDPSMYPQTRFKDKEYMQYVEELMTYIVHFFQKTRILANPEASISHIKQEAEKKWVKENGHSSSQTDPLFCKACDKLFASQAVYDHHLKGRKHIKNSEREQSPNADITTKNSTQYTISKCETVIQSVSELLTKEIAMTRANAQRRQGLTNREWQTEILERQTIEEAAANIFENDDQSESDGSDSDYDSASNINNPLNLPLDVTGKPIPFWLYKLNGLGHQFRCQICGDHVYMGRAKFEQHFVEPRHVDGLKSLGIRPSPVFKDITEISDAIALWRKIRRESPKVSVKKENVIQVEDEDGNVMTQKMYQDMKNQGLL